MKTKLLPSLIGLFLAALLLVACGGQAAEPVAEAPPPATAIPPTETPVPPTVTPVPPTATPDPPTETPVPPPATPEPTPTQALGKSPSPRGYVGMVYDAESDLMILFGGQTGECCSPLTQSTETWAFDATTNVWTLLEPASSPSTSTWGAMAYDAESDRTIVFGTGDIFPHIGSETWAFDTNSNTWTQMASGPSAHLGAELAYDAESDRVILFGGWDLGSRFFNDTWAYDFNTDTWTRMRPANMPLGRNFQAMTYDAESDRVLMWGSLEEDFERADESIWAYDFNSDTWEQMPIVEPFPDNRLYPRLVYDGESDRTILYGGTPGGLKTWAYDYNTNSWTLMEPAAGPGHVSRHAMAYNAAADRVLLFGGERVREYDYTDQTWSYDYNSDAWENLTP